MNWEHWEEYFFDASNILQSNKMINRTANFQLHSHSPFRRKHLASAYTQDPEVGTQRRQNTGKWMEK